MGDSKQTVDKDEPKARKRHRGLGRKGLRPSEPVRPQGDEQGLGHEGADRDQNRETSHGN
jgi:hypothetical protein